MAMAETWMMLHFFVDYTNAVIVKPYKIVAFVKLPSVHTYWLMTEDHGNDKHFYFYTSPPSPYKYGGGGMYIRITLSICPSVCL